MASTHSCSVIMVSYYTGPVLFAAVKGALAQENLAEIIVVNNGNPPDMLARLQQMTLGNAKLKIIDGGGNVGFATGCNLGAAQATGDFVLLLNPDCLLPPAALSNVMNAFGEVKGAMLAGCKLVSADGAEQRGSRRQLLTPKIALSESLALHRVLNWKRLNEHETPMPNVTHEVPAISGAFMAIRRADYQRLGGLDEAFFLHVEDLDFCMRVHKAGGKVICAPSVEVAHLKSTSGKTSSRFIEWHKAKGFGRYFEKHFDHQRPTVWALNIAIMARFGLKALWHFLRGFFTVYMSRDEASKRLMILASGLVDLPEKKDWAGKTVLVTGATSQLGLSVIRRLIASGASVLALSRETPIPFYHAQLRWIKGDLTDPNLHFEDYVADVAIHCAPSWVLPPALDRLAETEVKRIVAFGSTSIFGKALSRNTYEKEIVEKHTRAEAAIAEHCDEKKIGWTILRPTMVYGVGLDHNITTLARFIDRFGFLAVYPPATGRRQPVHVDDLAIAALAAAKSEASAGKSYNVSGGEVIPYREMLERLFILCRRRTQIFSLRLLPFALDIAGWAFRKPGINGEIARRMNDDLVFFHDDAKRDFGFQPRPFLNGGLKDIEGF